MTDNTSGVFAPAPKQARGRLAPSPTGRLHLGNAFAFLAAWLSVRQRGGVMALRMEDIDPERSREGFALGILEDLSWLGLDWDEGPDKGGPCAPYTQSRRLGRYAEALADLDGRGLTYACYCTRKELRMLASAPHIGDEGVPYPGTCRKLTAKRRAELERQGRKACVRLNTEAAAEILAQSGAGSARQASPALAFNDGVRGAQCFSLQDCGGDFALRRSDGVFAYQLAVACDDADMGVTQVVRGDDLLLSTPRQLLLLALMGKSPPSYAHVPLVHDAQGERLAKRHKSLELAALREAGIAPAAVTGYLAHLAGWRERPEALEPRELIAGFSLAALGGRVLRLPENAPERLLRLSRKS